MAKYIFAYHGGGMPESEEEQAQHMAAWGEWMGSVGDAFIDMGAPTSTAQTVSRDGVADGGGSNPVTGYSLVEAADFEAATNIAKDCPVVVLGGGTVEVAETFEISM